MQLTKLARALRTHHAHTAVVQQSPLWMRAITVGLSFTALFGLGWLSFAQTEEIVVAQGKLEPKGRVVDVQAPVGGVISKLLVKEGSRVNAGDLLFSLDAKTNQDRQRSLQESLQYKKKQLELKLQERKNYLSLNSSQLSLLGKNLALQQQIEAKFNQLAREGASAELQALQQRNQVAQVRAQLQQTQIDRQRQLALLDQTVQQLKTEISDLQSRINELNVNLDYQAVRAPVSGVVFELKPRNNGFVTQSSEPLLKIVPFDKLEARVLVPSSDVGFVHLNQATDLSIDTFPASDFGVLEGKVTKIGSDALPPDPQNGQAGYRFPVEIQLSSQQLKLRNGVELPLQVGMSLTANIKLRKVSYLQLLLGSFKDKAQSLQRSGG
jgi:HlyD family secretion protein